MPPVPIAHSCDWTSSFRSTVTDRPDLYNLYVSNIGPHAKSRAKSRRPRKFGGNSPLRHRIRATSQIPLLASSVEPSPGRCAALPYSRRAVPPSSAPAGNRISLAPASASTLTNLMTELSKSSGRTSTPLRGKGIRRKIQNVKPSADLVLSKKDNAWEALRIGTQAAFSPMQAEFRPQAPCSLPRVECRHRHHQDFGDNPNAPLTQSAGKGIFVKDYTPEM